MTERLIAMYKDDNFITRDGCSEALLRMMTDGRGNLPLAEGAKQKPSCDGSDRSSSASFGLHGYPLASVYAPLQSFQELYDLDTAHKQGTIFKELDLDFNGRRLERGGRIQ